MCFQCDKEEKEKDAKIFAALRSHDIALAVELIGDGDISEYV